MISSSLISGGVVIRTAGKAHVQKAMEGRSGHVQMMAALRAAEPLIVQHVRLELIDRAQTIQDNDKREFVTHWLAQNLDEVHKT